MHSGASWQYEAARGMPSLASALAAWATDNPDARIMVDYAKISTASNVSTALWSGVISDFLVALLLIEQSF